MSTIIVAIVVVIAVLGVVVGVGWSNNNVNGKILSFTLHYTQFTTLYSKYLRAIPVSPVIYM